MQQGQAFQIDLIELLAWQIVSFVILTTEMRLLAFEAGVFITIIVANLILSIVFIIICAKGATKETKMKKGDIKD